MTPEAKKFIAECAAFGINPDPWDRMLRKVPHHPSTPKTVKAIDVADAIYLAHMFACFEQHKDAFSSTREALGAYPYLLDIVFELEDARNEKAKLRA